MKTVTLFLIVITIAATLCAAPVPQQPARGVPAEAGALPDGAQAAAAGSVRKGMTWRLRATNTTTGTAIVGCDFCDPYQGDVPCTTALPLLCIKKTGAGFPLPAPASVTQANLGQNYRWSGGVIGTTKATVPPPTLAAADALCAQEFGAGWRVAEFHDGWGWNFQAYGSVGNPLQRFWVHINDQPGGRCW
ncbi:MAG TPA: flagellar hook-length control protein [Thermoanaerobaculia bacterium]|nr:flagellar hook-length control protein [Thermoanaerobaculia bacterium]